MTEITRFRATFIVYQVIYLNYHRTDEYRFSNVKNKNSKRLLSSPKTDAHQPKKNKHLSITVNRFTPLASNEDIVNDIISLPTINNTDNFKDVRALTIRLPPLTFIRGVIDSMVFITN